MVNLMRREETTDPARPRLRGMPACAAVAPPEGRFWVILLKPSCYASWSGRKRAQLWRLALNVE